MQAHRRLPTALSPSWSSTPISKAYDFLFFSSFLKKKNVFQQSIGLGTSWTHRALGQGEVHVTSSTLRALGLEPNAGNRVNIIVDANALLQVLNTVFFFSLFSNAPLAIYRRLKPLARESSDQLSGYGKPLGHPDPHPHLSQCSRRQCHHSRVQLFGTIKISRRVSS